MCLLNWKKENCAFLFSTYNNIHHPLVYVMRVNCQRVATTASAFNPTLSCKSLHVRSTLTSPSLVFWPSRGHWFSLDIPVEPYGFFTASALRTLTASRNDSSSGTCISRLLMNSSTSFDSLATGSATPASPTTPLTGLPFLCAPLPDSQPDVPDAHQSLMLATCV